MPDMGSPGPYRGELGDVSEGSIRTAAIVRWPGHIPPRTSQAMVSIMDFFPTFARLVDGKVPDDRPIDGIDQTDLLLGTSATGQREHLLTFVGPDLLVVRWKQFRAYFADVTPGRSGWGGMNVLAGTGGSAAPMNGYPKIFNIESDPRGVQHRRDVRMGDRADAEVGGAIQGESREAPESASSEHDAILTARLRSHGRKSGMRVFRPIQDRGILMGTSGNICSLAPA